MPAARASQRGNDRTHRAVARQRHDRYSQIREFALAPLQFDQPQSSCEHYVSGRIVIQQVARVHDDNRNRASARAP
jgi:hypothetical protein